MGVIAKFRCNSVTNYGPMSGFKVSMTAVTDKLQNADFSAATPSGTFEMAISPGMPAASYFEPGSEYYFKIEKDVPAIAG